MRDENVSLVALRDSLRRIQDFAKVQAGRDAASQYESVTVVQGYLGLTESHREELAVWMEDFLGESSGEVLLGVMIGLMMAQHDQ